MIVPLADDFLHGQGAGALEAFDDEATRVGLALRASLRQLAPPTPDGGREVLWFCPRCRRPWYERGRSQSFACLSGEQLARIADRLQADARSAVFCLPELPCDLCAALHLGGLPRIEEYQNGGGYRLLWQRVRSPARFLCALYPVSGRALAEGPLPLREALTRRADVPFSPMSRAGRVLEWLARLPAGDGGALAPLAPGYCQLRHRRDSPPQCLRWSACWAVARCPPLGDVLAVFAIARAGQGPLSPPVLVDCWRQIARVMMEWAL